MIVHRRDFLKSAAAGIPAVAGLRPMPATDAEIEIDPSQPGPQINPHIYGHFIEHLGGVVYDGIWVGRNSRIPNLDGIRKQFVDSTRSSRRRETSTPARLPTTRSRCTGLTWARGSCR